MSSPVQYFPIKSEILSQISALHARVFGPGRYAKSAYRVREGAPLISPACMSAWRNGQLVGAIRFTAIRIGDRDRAMLLGPLAVSPDCANQGIGKHLMELGIERARAGGSELVILVGDLPYYARVGFGPVPAGQITLPGPVEPDRLLARELISGCLEDYRGPVKAILHADQGHRL